VDDHFLSMCRYVERNPLRANLVKRAEDWRWSSLWQRSRATQVPWLSAWPMEVPSGWTAHVNQAQTASEVGALRLSVQRGTPFGEKSWQKRTAKALELESSLRLPGRPRKRTEKET
jgi:putative transposase